MLIPSFARNRPSALHGIQIVLAVGLTLACHKVSPVISHSAPEEKPHSTPGRTSEDPSRVYSANPNDSWNQIFYSLFTRTLKVRLSIEFPEGAPFTRTPYGQLPHELSVSTRLFDRVEVGDRGIEPLYPSFISPLGVSEVLSEPLYPLFKQALTGALEETAARDPLDRALMQADLWGAYDLLFRVHFTGAEDQQPRRRRDELRPLLARLIKKVALTQEEISALPHNYDGATTTYHLPKLFDQRGGWMEIQWHPERLHDRSADFRRSTRVYIKPASTPPDKEQFLNALRNAPDIASKLDSVALLTQDLLIDSAGKVVPSPITYDVQLRHFSKNAGGILKTDVEEYELSRRLLLGMPTSSGFVELNDKTSVYLPEAGNDYGFASQQRGQPGSSPVLVNLRSRCIACHGQEVAGVLTFSISLPSPFAAVAELNPLGNDHAIYVAERKVAQDDFRVLKEQGWGSVK